MTEYSSASPRQPLSARIATFTEVRDGRIHRHATYDCYEPLRDVAELLSLGEALELLERLILDLADALARHVERAPDLVERARMLPAEAVPQLEHATLAVGEVLQGLAQRFLGEDLGCALVRRLRPLVGDELPE